MPARSAWFGMACVDAGSVVIVHTAFRPAERVNRCASRLGVGVQRSGTPTRTCLEKLDKKIRLYMSNTYTPRCFTWNIRLLGKGYRRADGPRVSAPSLDRPISLRGPRAVTLSRGFGAASAGFLRWFISQREAT